MTTHTPGPWSIESDTFFKASIYDDGKQVCPISKQPMGGKLVIACISHRRDSNEAAANARLIAAAPELLAACEVALPAIRWAETHTTGNAVQFVEVVNLLNAVIAKATGQSKD